jgi:hypothetical protein
VVFIQSKPVQFAGSITPQKSAHFGVLTALAFF